MNNCLYRLLVSLISLLMALDASAYFVENGLYYDYAQNSTSNEVSVISLDRITLRLYTGDIVVPESVVHDGVNYTVTGIGPYAFASTTVTSLKLPKTIRAIDEYAFYKCNQLKSVELSDGLETIGSCAFEFSDIRNIRIPGTVKSIASDAFKYCGLETIDMGEYLVEVISKEMFLGCSNLRSIKIPKSLTTIEKEAFRGCSSLESIDFPENLSQIGDYSFSGCTSLQSITISDSNTFISMGYMSFDKCSNLKTIQSKSEIPRCYFFGSGLSSPLTIYVPYGCKDYYQDMGVECDVVEVPGTVSLIITSSGNGSVSYGGTSIRSGNNTFSVTQGTDVTVLFYPDNCYRIKSVKINKTDVTSKVSNNSYTISSISANTTLEVEFEAIPIPTYTLSVKATGNGSATYDGTTAKNNTQTFTLNEGTSATITFTPDNGYRIKSVKVNSTDVTSKVLNNSYTISSISANTTVEVEFEAIPIPTYTLSIKATGNGSATYNGTTAKNSTKTFTLNEGTSATITFSPDNGYRIKNVKVNSTDVTSSVSNNQYTVSNIKANTTVEVEFEAIPIPTYTLSIKATGNGSATCNGTTAKNNTKTFTLNEGTSATITFSPDNGYRIKSVKVNSTDVTSSVSNNQYTVSNIKANTTVEVVFEAIPVTTYTLSIKATGNGSATYDGTTAKNGTKSFAVNEGTSATITFTPDNGYRIKSVKVNSTDVTSSVSINQYTVSSIKANTTVEVVFEAIPVTTYTLSIKATGNGSATYDGTTAKNNTKSFTLNEGSNATITFTPDNGYRIKSVKVNSKDVTSSVSNNQYTVSSIKANTTVEVVFEAIPVTTYTLSIKATGNGSATYDGTTAKNNTKSFTLNEGSNATITFTPDNGYRIKSVKVNSTDVTSSVSNNQYTVSNIKANTTLEVEFEAIPIPTYTLSVKATGNGSATYNGTTAKNNTQSFTLNEGTSATITFSPDNGYRIKSVKVNNTDVTSSVSNNSYTVSSIKANTTVEVVFEAIPITTYTLSIKATGNGSATYDGTTAKNSTKSFTLSEGTSATITFIPDNGYRIKSVKVNSTDVTSSVSNNQYTVSKIKANTTVEVEFEAIPITTYTLSIKATGNGSASYDGTTAKNNTKSFTVNEGANATITFSPDNGYRIKSVKVNSTDVTSSVSNNQYTVSNIKANTTVEVEFEAIPVTTYTLSIKATGNGSATYDGTTAKNNTKSFTLDEGTSATITFAPDNGHRIKSVKVNSTDVTSSVSNNQYTVSNIKANTSVEVEFETIPVTTYTLSVKATGNGSATYNGTTAKNNTQTFTLNEGTSATITFSPDNGYRIKSVKVNSTDVTSSVSNNQYTVSNIKAKTTVEVEFEAIPVVINTYTLSVKATGNGSATYNGTTAKNDTKTFTLNEGTSATISFAPDNGYRIKSVKVNSTDVTSSVSNSNYTVSNIKANTTVEVEFEAIPVTTYTLSIKATGSGSATYDGTTAKNNTQTFTLNEGTSATITFSPDNGCRIKSVKVNSTDVTANVSYSQYTVSNISTDITVEVEFEAIPVNTYILKYVVDDETYKTYELSEGAAITPEAEPTKEGYTFSGWSEIPATMPAEDVTITGSFTKNEPEIKTYALSIRAIGSGSASYSGTTIINSTRTFTVNEGTSATITFSPDNGYRIKSVTENGTDVTLSVSFSQYTINNISANTTIEVEFEAIPVNTYTLKYVVDGETYKTYELKEGAVILPEAEPTKEGYTFSGWSEIPETMPAEDITITGTFTKIESLMTVDGVNYETVSFSEHLVVVAEGDYGPVLEVPETITYENETWTVMGLKDGALENCENLAAVIWDPSAVFNARVSNPNLLLYVKDKSNASYGVKNVIVNKKAESIELTDASSGNDFYCPRAFKAKKISYSHRYNMETGLGDSKGWETIVLPFDVQKYTSPKGEIIPFTKWANSDSKKPFWLFELTASGYKDVEGIKANTPYIISMPNNPQYQADYVIIGLVTFSAENAEVKASDEMQSANYQDRTFVPNYTNKAGEDCLALNVNNYYVTNPGTDIDGSKFIKGLRAVHPFEAYMTTTSNTRSIDVMDGMTTAIRDIVMTAEGKDIIKVYDTRGILVKTVKAYDDLRMGLASGVYIVNGKKMIIK